MARESALDYELARQLGMTLNEVREQGLGAALEDSKADIAAGRVHSMEEVEAYVNATHVALFGGSFDPPTIGHIAFVKFLLQHFDQVWVVPCPSHMFGKSMTPAPIRLEMCRLAFSGIHVLHDMASFYPGEEANVTIESSLPRLAIVSDYEIHNKLSGAAIDFVTALLAEPTAEYVFHFAIGMDNAHNFQQWVRWQELLRLIPFVVVPRAGEEIDVAVDWYNQRPHQLLVPDEPLPLTSSTEVREIIKNGEDFDRLYRLINAPIIDYIRDQSLYVS